MKIHLAFAIFEEPISPVELNWFRGAIIKLANDHPLFHNHKEQGYNYTYPKIQYKLIGGRPAVLGIEEGAEALTQILMPGRPIHCRLGNSTRVLHVASIGEWDETIGVTQELRSYVIENWLPLNARNYEEYHNASGLVGRLSMLDRILIGNILSFSKGMGLFFDSHIIAHLEDLESNGAVTYKGVDLLSFSGTFKSNVVLPQWIGLGKSASLNHGIITQL